MYPIQKDFKILKIDMSPLFPTMALSLLTRRSVQKIDYPADGQPCYALLDDKEEIVDYLLEGDVLVHNGKTWAILTPELFNIFFE